jgi:ribosomal protein L11 methyltransferase
VENYKAFTINIFPLNNDIVSGALWELPIDGITEESFGLIIYAKESSSVNIKLLEDSLLRLKNENLLERFSISEKSEEPKNWNEVWEKKLKIINVGKKIVIKPSFKEYKPESDEIVIELDPKMSFGTGEHSTTQLCLEILESQINRGDSVFDFGSGTSLLSIAAAKLGAGKVLAADNDEWCLINGLENVKLNNVQNSVKVIKATIDKIDETDFDLIIANINKNILIESVGEISDKIIEAGKLILSGFYTHDALEISKVFENHKLTIISQYTKNEWAAILMRKTI